MSKVIALVGPTAIGKTALSVYMAKKLDANILCCDSMQIYKYMDIGTAKPTDEETEGVTHQMFGFLDPLVNYSAADYQSDAKKYITENTREGKNTLICGGTGLYLDALRYGRLSEEANSDPEYRKALEITAKEPDGADKLYEMLLSCDRESAESMHKNNVKRVIRALEIYHVSGKKKSDLDRESKNKPIYTDMTAFALVPTSRELLYSRINMRVDKMIESGLLDETKKLYEKGYLFGTTAASAIGYKELLPYVKGEMTLDACIEELKTATRRYAKRQLTWFCAHDDIIKIAADDGEKLYSKEELFEKIKLYIEEKQK